MKYILEKNNKYLVNIVTGFNTKTKSIFSENIKNAIKFSDINDAKNQAIRFCAEVVHYK